MKILVRNIRIPFDRDAEYALERAKRKIKPLGAVCTDASVYKRSLDARHNDAIAFVYTVCMTLDRTFDEQTLKRCDALELTEDTLAVEYGTQIQQGAPVITGFGPCGMFCALLLAEQGYCPVVIERGADTARRVRAVETFYRTGKLDLNSNIQFGAGGAGTFSDGKLVTRINDPYCRYVLSRFCEFGAPEQILTDARPHIGTDLLRGIVDRIAARILELGGKILFDTRLRALRVNTDRVVAAVTDEAEIPCSSLVLAIGHSARDTYNVLSQSGVALTAKPFSVGVRIEHLQSEIDRALYGRYAGHPKLPAGEYSLSGKFEGRGVYSFCMCPGGTVAAAASEEGGVVTNGMSEFARAGKNANSALAVSVLPQDYGGSVAGAVSFVREIEQKAYRMGGGDFRAPVQTVGDFLSGKHGREPSDVEPTYRDGAVTVSDLNRVLPSFVCRALRSGIAGFEKKLNGFSAAQAVLTGAETRTSSPIRIPREEDGTAIGFDNLYPCGEGAGYAGGITSAAVDGIRCALKIMKRYQR